MAILRQVKCINKTNRTSPHERISYIGGDWGKTSVSDAIIQIGNKTHEYYVMVGIYRANVEIAYHNGNPYLKTDRDTTTADNLLSLPECS